MRKHDKAAKTIVLVRNILLVLYIILALVDGWLGWKDLLPAPKDNGGNMSAKEEFLKKWDVTEPERQAGTDGWLLTVLNSLLIADLACVAGLTFCAKCLRREEDKEGSMMPYGEEGAAMQSYPHTESVKVPEGHGSQSVQSVRVGPAEFGKAHNIGRRPVQQDSFGKTEVFQGQGILAVVADGMGGLSGGDQVSQRIVMGMLAGAAQLQPCWMDGILQQMVCNVNEDINQMLGPDGLYKSGSTLLAVLAEQDSFHWIAIGDSRIYLYREGQMLQVNQEHTQLQEWMPDILDGKMSYAEAVRNPDGAKLTSFIGMGKLKYVDCSLRGVGIAPGDRILLMSDGVFNTLSEQEMAGILGQYHDVQQAANVFEQKILAAQVPTQDNFTAVILGF